MPILEVLRRQRQLKRFLKFVKELVQQQIEAGGRFMFEHPTGSVVWNDPQMQAWCQEFTSVVTNMCCYDLHLPERDGKPKRYIRKSTRLLCSHEDMCSAVSAQANLQNTSMQLLQGVSPELDL